jgi:hypothetical protein
MITMKGADATEKGGILHPTPFGSLRRMTFPVEMIQLIVRLEALSEGDQ